MKVKTMLEILNKVENKEMSILGVTGEEGHEGLFCIVNDYFFVEDEQAEERER